MSWMKRSVSPAEASSTARARRRRPGTTNHETAEIVTVVLSLIAPYIAEEMWEALGHAPSVAKATWPRFDPALLVTETVTCVVQVQGKVRERLEVAPDIAEDELRALALASDGVVKSLAGRDVRTVVVRAPKLVNVVPA